MTLEWSSDCCGCIIWFDMPNKTFVKWIQKCQLHKDLDRQKLLDTVLAHTASFNFDSTGLTEQQFKDKIEIRKTEKKRIRDLGVEIKN